MVQRLQVFYEYPKNVNIEVNLAEELTFPAVTICNQNLFR